MYDAIYDSDAMKPYAEFAEAMFESAQALQAAYIGAMEQMAELFTAQTKAWLLDNTGSAKPSPTMGEDQMREMFHQIANANLRQWEYIAAAVQATPSWMQWPYTAPGSYMTEWFDQFNRYAAAQAAGASAPAEEAVPAPAPTTADDLTALKGVGKKIAAGLNDLGVTSYAQIAGWTKEEADQVSEELGFSGRANREKWRQQAAKLVKAAS